MTLSGTVSSSGSLSHALAVAEAYSPKMINLLEVAGVQQVMLEVRVAEMNRTIAPPGNQHLVFPGGGLFSTPGSTT